MPDPVWFWQRIVSPHMAGLVSELASLGREVTYVAERSMSADRAAMGWRQPDLGGARLLFAPDAGAMRRLAAAAPDRSIHICQGLRGNGLVGSASQALARRDFRRWIVMETVEDNGWRGLLRRLEYRRLILSHRGGIEGILATGHATADWLAARGMPRERIYPFAYFLPAPSIDISTLPENERFRILYVGSLITRKRVDLLIDAVISLGDVSVDLEIVGSGPLEEELRHRAAGLGNRIRWLGRREMTEIPALMARADCLVLPSRYDGWGAVVSEALMVGTPAICSDACGVAGVVKASGCGGVFRSKDVNDLSRVLRQEIGKGSPRPRQRRALSDWAKCLGASEGAHYLTRIFDHPAQGNSPPPPWQVETV